MPGKGVFKARRFQVQQDRCAMKVSTDGILLGCLASIADARSILDIGCGTGLLSLMAAQRNANAFIDAVELNVDAAEQAAENIGMSEWAGRIRVHNVDILNYEPGISYDAILCNPPYFEQDLRSPDQGRNTARHDSDLDLKNLVAAVDRLLSPRGTASLILPVERYSELVEYLINKNLNINHICKIYYLKGGPLRRYVLRLSRTHSTVAEASMVVQHRSNQYTDQYRELTKEFLIKTGSDQTSSSRNVIPMDSNRSNTGS